MADKTYHLNGGFKPTLKRFADLDGPDFFPTPSWATHALIENEKFAGDIWECACGDGAMSKVLENVCSNVISTDLHERGYGEAGYDFIGTERVADNIITNPPYNCAETFVRTGVQQSKKKFALLLRLAFLEGANRARTIFTECPPSRVWVFSERITFYPAGAVKKGSGTTAYAWFVWDSDAFAKNPPYNCAETFVRTGVQQSKKKFALLLRLAFLEGANRARTIFTECPPSRVWVFSERITFYPAGAVKKGSGTTAYAWFVWDSDAQSGTELRWLEPVYKARYSGT